MTPALSRLITLGGRGVEYAVKFSPSARRVRIRVSPAGVVVILPWRVEVERAETFLRENSSWVLDQLRFVERAGSIREPTARHPGPTLMLRGEQTPVRVVQEKAKRLFGLVRRANGEIIVRVPVEGNVDPSRALEAWLRREARSDIRVQMNERIRQIGRRPAKVFVMGQRTKWGGCSASRNISINWRLVMSPPVVMDYVIVHELVHLIEPYHSQRFWLVVMSHCSDYQRHRRWLRENGHRLALPAALQGRCPAREALVAGESIGPRS
jgi:predicted metal-dependent hydrolase